MYLWIYVCDVISQKHHFDLYDSKKEKGKKNMAEIFPINSSVQSTVAAFSSSFCACLRSPQGPLN